MIAFTGANVHCFARLGRGCRYLRLTPRRMQCRHADFDVSMSGVLPFIMRAPTSRRLTSADYGLTTWRARSSFRRIADASSMPY